MAYVKCRVSRTQKEVTPQGQVKGVPSAAQGVTQHIITCDRALITSYLLIDNTVHSTGQRFPL